MFEDFKLGCLLLAGWVQSIWGGLNAFEQWLAFGAGACFLGAFVGWVAGKITLWRRGRKSVYKLTAADKASLKHLQYDPIAEYGGECHVCDSKQPVIFFPVLLQADAWLENYQRAYRPSEEE